MAVPEQLAVRAGSIRHIDAQLSQRIFYVPGTEIIPEFDRRHQIVICHGNPDVHRTVVLAILSTRRMDIPHRQIRILYRDIPHQRRRGITLGKGSEVNEWRQ